jgi:hypothetical protein
MHESMFLKTIKGICKSCRKIQREEAKKLAEELSCAKSEIRRLERRVKRRDETIIGKDTQIDTLQGIITRISRMSFVTK